MPLAITLETSIAMLEAVGRACDCVVNQTLHHFELQKLSSEIDRSAHADAIPDTKEFLGVSVPMINTCQDDIFSARYALNEILNLTATLLEAAEVLAEVNLHMVSQSSAAGDFESDFSKSTPGRHNTTSSSKREEEEERDSQGVSPIDLAVAMESACWDLDFLVSLNIFIDISLLRHRIRR